MVNRRFSDRSRVIRRGDRRRADLLVGLAGERSLDEVLYSVERREILTALARAGGQRTKAAESLGISRSRLYRRMAALGIELNGASSNGRR